MKTVIFNDFECYIKGTDEKISNNTYKISEHIAIAIGYSCQSTDEFLFSGNRKSYFGSNCIKDDDKIY